MSEEKKKRKMTGEGYYIMTVSEDGRTFTSEQAAYPTARDAEEGLKSSAVHYNGEEVAIVKVQKRIKVTVENRPVVRFE